MTPGFANYGTVIVEANEPSDFADWARGRAVGLARS